MVLGALTMFTASTFVVGVPVYRVTSWWADRAHRRQLQRSRTRRL